MKSNQSKKLWYLVGVSLKRKVKTKWFVIANILLAAMIIGVMNIDTIITAFGGDFNEKTTVYVLDETDESYELFQSQMGVIDQATEEVQSDEEEPEYIVKKYQKSEKELKQEIKDDNKKIGVIISPSEQNVVDVTLISNEFLEMLETQRITSAINNTKTALAISKSSISEEELAAIYDPVKINRIYLDESKTEEDESSQMIMGMVFPIIILPFFMLTLFLVQMIGAEVNDEKTTRGMEIIIANVSPSTHFFSKVIAGNTFVIMQGILLVAYAGVGFITRMVIGGDQIIGRFGDEIGSVVSNVMGSGIGQSLIYIIPLTLILMILTFIAYSLLAGILASMTTNIEDFQQLQTPIVIISLVGYYLATLSSMFGGSLFIKMFSYIPFISAILSPSLLLVGEIGIIDIIISIVLVVITNFLLVKYGLKIYKVGILNYSSKGLWRKMFKALKD